MKTPTWIGTRKVVGAEVVTVVASRQGVVVVRTPRVKR